MRQVEELAAALKAIGMDARAWQDSRVYLNRFGRDVTAYIALDDGAQEAEKLEDLYDGCALRVFVDCPSQTGAWRTNRAKQVKHNIMVSLAEAAADGDLKSPIMAATTVCEDWRDVIL